jgi:hypothetical protein
MSIKSQDQIRKEREVYYEALFINDSLKRERIDFCIKIYANTRSFRAFLNFMDPIHKQTKLLNISTDNYTNNLHCRYIEFTASTIMILPQSLRVKISPAFSNRDDTLNEFKSFTSFDEKYQYAHNIFKRTCDLLISYIPSEELGVVYKGSNQDSIFNKIKRFLFRN